MANAAATARGLDCSVGFRRLEVRLGPDPKRGGVGVPRFSHRSGETSCAGCDGCKGGVEARWGLVVVCSDCATSLVSSSTASSRGGGGGRGSGRKIRSNCDAPAIL